MTFNGVIALFCVISANSGGIRAHCVKIHVPYLISWWVIVYTYTRCFRWSPDQTGYKIGHQFNSIQLQIYIAPYVESESEVDNRSLFTVPHQRSARAVPGGQSCSCFIFSTSTLYFYSVMF